jgi:ferric-dicitrate binding protein FerR (iron transport regulator)
MIQDIPWQMLEKYFAKKSTDIEEKQVLEWIAKVPENSMIFNQLQDYYLHGGALPLDYTPDAQAALQQIQTKLKLHKKGARRILIYWYAAAASLLLFIAFGLLPHVSYKPKLLISQCLNDSTKALVLSDGTKVWLNEGSKLEYPEKFNSKREVRLIGEGYFEVIHDPAHPFIIQTAENTIKDIGTKFDIRSYAEENDVFVSVTEGKASFANQNGKQVVLQHGQKCSYLKNSNRFEPVTVIDPNLLAWKTKEFIFENEPLSKVFKTLAPIYHCNYKFRNEALKNLKITTQFKSLPLHDIISIIAIATNTEITVINQKNKPEIIIK